MKANVYDEGRAPAVPQLNEVGKPTSQKTWVINLAVAEWVIRKRPAAPARTASAVVSQLH